jgi:Cathepsin propeptide inhibitor domain (I29)
MLMRVSSFLLVLLLPLPAVVVVHAAVEEEHLSAAVAFLSWIDLHAKTYDSQDEQEKRMEIWMQNDGTCVEFVC